MFPNELEIALLEIKQEENKPSWAFCDYNVEWQIL